MTDSDTVETQWEVTDDGKLKETEPTESPEFEESPTFDG